MGRVGSGAVLAKLADVFLTQVLRPYLEGAEAAGLLRAERSAIRRSDRRSSSCKSARAAPDSCAKAFKRAFGQSPDEYRREHASSPIRIADVSATETAGQAVTAAKNGWGCPVSA
jgi:hypothetical protein